MSLFRIRRKVTQPVPQPGDIVRNADGALCLLTRIGWNDKYSPYFVEEDNAEYTRAYVIGLEQDEHGNYSLWSDWALFAELQAADEAGQYVFTGHVMAAEKYTHLFMVESETAEAFAAAV